MEADLFQEIFDVLESRQNRLEVKIQNGSPVTKILLSTFDYMSGPELKFSWIPQYVEPSLLLLDDQIDDSSSDRITSSSKQTNEDLQLQYDESEFLASNYDEPENLNKYQNRMCVSTTSWLGHDTQPSASTLRSSSYDNTTITLNNEQKDPYENKTDDGHSSYTNVSGDEAGGEDSPNEINDDQIKNTAMITSCVDSGITGTVSMHSDLSNCRSPKPTSSNSAVQQQPIDELNSGSDSDYGYCAEDTDQNESGHGGSDDSENLIDCVEKHATASFLNASSNIVGLSMLGALDYSENVSITGESKALHQLSTDNQKTGDYQTLTDEEFVAKFVLAEQICSIQFDSNPIVQKISVLPNRQLMLCSYLFCAKNDVRTMMAISVLMHEESEAWFYQREAMFEQIFIDLITRYKTSLLVEQEADQICRLTSEFIELFNLLGTLERYPLVGASNSWKIDLAKTDLMDDYLEKQDLRFLYRAITGCLMCQGGVVVFGNNTELVEKLLLTLAVFVHSSQRFLCLAAHSFHYSPYVKLQGLKRAETEDLYMLAGDSHWPVCFIDIDKKTVATSGNYFTHHSRKEALQIYSISQIFQDAEANVDSSTLRPPIITPIPLEIDIYTANMLDSFFLLTAEQSERFAFIQHFQMNLDYKAKALIQTVKELSEPANNFKENFVSSKWSLSSARKLLNLSAETTFWIVVARADLITSSFAQFLFQTVKLHR